MVCPMCEGGSRKRRTLSMNLRDGIWLYLCHRGSCPVRGAFPAIGNDGKLVIGKTGAHFEPRPLGEAYCLPWSDCPIFGRLAPVVGNVQTFATAHGLRAIESRPGTHVWRIRNVAGKLLGHVTRTEAKLCLTYREEPGPFYGYFPGTSGGPPHRPVVLVEDCLSAALLADNDFPAIALLSTDLSREAVREIVDGLPSGTRFVVALDPDAPGQVATARVVYRLHAAGADARRFILPQDVNKMTRPEILEVCEALCKI